jgi:HAE1 family hydrophobic/amphiphilic exporter-1
MSLTSLFVRRPLLAFVLLALIVLAGWAAWTTLVRQLNPNVPQPTITISVSYNGASTTVMRDSIIAPLEDQISGTPNLQTTSSTIQAGTATISASFALQSDINTDMVNVQKAVQNASKYLPLDLTPPTIRIADPSEPVVVTLSLTSAKMTPSELSQLALNRIVPAFQQVSGISNVGVGGSVIPAYEVTVDPHKLEAHKLTLTDVIGTISTDNVRAPGGVARQPNRWTQVDIRGDIVSPDSIRGLPIAAPASGSGAAAAAQSTGQLDPWTSATSVLRLSDVATVTAGNEPRLSYASMNGIAGVSLQLQKTSNSSEVTASDNVLAALSRIRSQFPDVTFGVIEVNSVITRMNLDSVTRTLVEGIVLTGLVMLFFLKSWRNAVVVLISIPASLAVALFVMKLFNLTLDTISLLGMTLAIGILVDDSTVVLENIERHFEQGQSPREAAIAGRSEIGMAAIVITLVDVVVFLPIAFIQGQVGRNLAEFGIVIVISTLTSLVVSFTITPALAGNWALQSSWKAWAPIEAFGRAFDRVRSWYAHRVLPWGLRHPVSLTAACFASLVLAMALLRLGVVGEEFIPPVDRGEIFVQIQYPVGTPLTTTTNGVLRLERALLQTADAGVDLSLAGQYSAPFGGDVVQSNVGQVHIWLTESRAHPTSYWLPKFQEIAQRTLPDALTIVVPETGHGTGQPIDELVTDTSGGDPTPYAQRIMSLMQRTPGAVNVISSVAGLTPQVELIFDRAKARALNVSIGAASAAARAAFGGTIATQFETTNGLEQVQVIYPNADRTNLAAFASIPVRSKSGAIVHVGDFASLRWAPGPPLITRVNRQTIIHVSANVAPGSSLSAVQRRFLSGVSQLNLPPKIAVHAVPSGQQDLMQQTLTGLGDSLVLSIVLVFLLMVALYNSLRSPLIIMFSVPVAAVGALGALAVTRETLNLYSLIGTILLVGVVAKNGILLVDYANTLRERGRDKLAAIRESAFTRFRPIVMTSIAMISGNLPLALALEPGSGVRSSLGVVVIGGITSSLILTLVLVPVMYVWLAPKHFAPAHSLEAVSATPSATPA